MAQILIEMDGHDFARLTVNSTEWAKNWDSSWRNQAMNGRFKHMGSDGGYDWVPRSSWNMAYWLEADWSHVMLCRAFLRAEGHECEVTRDLVAIQNGDVQFVLLTDYRSPRVAGTPRHPREDEMEADLAFERSRNPGA